MLRLSNADIHPYWRAGVTLEKYGSFYSRGINIEKRFPPYTVIGDDVSLRRRHLKYPVTMLWQCSFGLGYFHDGNREQKINKLPVR